jgi:hypothetical protein
LSFIFISVILLTIGHARRALCSSKIIGAYEKGSRCFQKLYFALENWEEKSEKTGKFSESLENG